MTDEAKRKCRFCENELFALLKCIDDTIVSAKYKVVDDEDEIVVLRFLNGYCCVVCVTADSLSAMVKDVLKAIE